MSRSPCKPPTVHRSTCWVGILSLFSVHWSPCLMLAVAFSDFSLIKDFFLGKISSIYKVYRHSIMEPHVHSNHTLGSKKTAITILSHCSTYHFPKLIWSQNLILFHRKHFGNIVIYTNQLIMIIFQNKIIRI